MVMDATPSPQSVGREFVRQYYTLLNKAPHHLHRFYNHQSSFVHGGLEPAAGTDTSNSARPVDCGLVIGQKQIHHKIQQLNFRDCHAKISQVDAQATLGNGVVVQVTGELSNDGQPMRRFTQTFVLAAQAPKKYYVHNDIFRYQDVVWDEDQQQQPDGNEQDSDARSEEVSDDIGEQQQGQMGGPGGMGEMQQQVHNHQVMQGQVPVQVTGQEQQQVHQQQQVNMGGAQPGGQMFYNAGTVKPAPGMQFPNAPSVNMNGHQQPQQPQVIPVVPAVVPSAVPVQQQQQIPAPVPQPTPTPTATYSEPTPTAPVASDKPVVVEELVKEKEVKPAPVQQQSSAPVVIEEVTIVEKKPPQPETFASLVKSGGGGGGRVMAARGPGAAPVVIQPVSVVSSPAAMTNNSRDNQGQQQQNNQHSGSTHNTNNSSGGAGGNVRERRTSNNANSYGDSQQLFVGNIPHHATEEELKAMFSKYGVVLDLRIFTKQSNAMAGGPKGGPGGRVPQNYGFVTFKESESAQAVLANSVSKGIRGREGLEEIHWKRIYNSCFC